MVGADAAGTEAAGWRRAPRGLPCAPQTHPPQCPPPSALHPSHRRTRSQRETRTTAPPWAPSGSPSSSMRTTAPCTAWLTVPRASSHQPQAPWTPPSKPTCCPGPARPELPRQLHPGTLGGRRPGGPGARHPDPGRPPGQLRTRTAGHAGAGLGGGVTFHGLTPTPAQDPAAVCVCVCEDPGCGRGAGRPPGELRLPLRKLVPSRARSFSLCLQKRRPVRRAAHKTKRPERLDTSHGMSLCAVRRTHVSLCAVRRTYVSLYAVHRTHVSLYEEELDAGPAAGLPANRILGYIWEKHPSRPPPPEGSSWKHQGVLCGPQGGAARRTLCCPCGTMTWAQPTTSLAGCS